MANTRRPDPRRALLDAAPGPLHPVARDTLLAALDAGWADPRRLHAEGRTARLLLDQAREVIASGLGARPPELSFQPSGPAALEAALAGTLHPRRRIGGRLVASAVEHSAVLTSGRARSSAADDADLFEEVPVDRLGRLDREAWTIAVARPRTAVAALQHANGEVGTMQPLAAARAETQRHGIPLVVDAQASLGRSPAPVDYDVLVGDAASFAGPPALGLLVVPERTRFRLPGTAREAEGGRSGSAPWVPLALAAAEAWQQAEAGHTNEEAQASDLVGRIRAAAAGVRDVVVAGDPDQRLPHIVTFSALYVDGEALVQELDRRGFAVASGSACTASTLEPSHVLAAMGVLTHGNVRVTLPLAGVRPDRESDVERFCEALGEAIAAVRAQLGVSDL